jgi:hypothetical protein
MKGPKAATAAVQPITPADLRGEAAKMVGYCLKVAALPTPVKKKIAIMIIKNIGN